MFGNPKRKGLAGIVTQIPGLKVNFTQKTLNRLVIWQQLSV